MIRFNNITKYCSVDKFKNIYLTEEGFQKMNWYKSNLKFIEVRNGSGGKNRAPEKILLYLYKFNKINHHLGWIPFQDPHSIVKIKNNEIVGIGNLDGGHRLIFYNDTLSITTHTPSFFIDWTDITKYTNRKLKLKEI